jgi:protocatechuate 3,4-dioxygenase beta subunit
MRDSKNPAEGDDAAVGRVLTRREAVLLLGGASAYGLLWVNGCTKTPDKDTGDGDGALDCAVKPELTEGPYYVDENLTRSDIRADSATGTLQVGIPLALTFNVSRIQSNACTPLPNAVVDVWHCSALGVYSDVQDPGFNTLGEDWLRGNQTTDANGAATFTTIFPGWYQGRATHIHFKIRSAAGADSTYQFTSQLFFPEDLLSAIYTEQEPYTTKGDDERLRNANDGIYGQGGSQLVLEPVSRGAGYAATLNIGVYDAADLPR